MTTNTEKKEFVKSIALFKNFSDDAMTQMSTILEETDYAAGDTIFLEDDPSLYLYIIISGEVMISKKTSEDTDKVLAVLSQPALFGEMSLFVNLPRTADAKAKTDVRCYKIHRDNFRKIYYTDTYGTINTIELFLLASLERLETTSRELATVHEISKILARDLPLQEFCNLVMKQVCYTIPCADSGVMFLFNKFSDDYVNTVKIDTEKIAYVSTAEVIDSTDKFIGYVKSLDGTVISTDDIVKKFITVSFPDRQNMSGCEFIISPFIKNEGVRPGENNLIGFIVLFHKTENVKYGPSTRDLMNSISCLLISAIDNIRTKEEEAAKDRLQKSKQSGSISW
jgi:CRP-like cAMP-binding protein